MTIRKKISICHTKDYKKNPEMIEDYSQPDVVQQTTEQLRPISFQGESIFTKFIRRSKISKLKYYIKLLVENESITITFNKLIH